MNNVIVTGANGFLGTWLLKTLDEHNKHVIAVVKDHNERIDGIKDLKNVEIVYCDMASWSSLPDILGESCKPDTMYHLAWNGTTGAKRADYALQLKNTGYTLDAVHAAYRLGCKRFIGAGTLAEKDCMAYMTLDGSTPNPVSHYGVAKIAAHFMSKTECCRLGMEHIWGEFSNIYGIGNTTGNFVNFAAKVMLSGQRASFTAAEQLYDFVYITDFINALYSIGEFGHANQSYFLGSGKPRQLKEYIAMIRDTIDPTIPLYLGEVPFNGVSLPLEAFSCDKLEQDTGYTAKVGFSEGIRLTVDWLRTQQNILEAI